MYIDHYTSDLRIYHVVFQDIHFDHCHRCVADNFWHSTQVAQELGEDIILSWATGVRDVKRMNSDRESLGKSEKIVA
jgi:hypothetical protein